MLLYFQFANAFECLQTRNVFMYIHVYL